MKKNKSIATVAMESMIDFLSFKEEDFGDLAEDLYGSGMMSSASVMAAKSAAMADAKNQAKILLDLIRREESKK